MRDTRHISTAMLCLWTTVGLLCFGPGPNSALLLGNRDFPYELYDAPSGSGSILRDEEPQQDVNKRSAFGLLGLATKRPHKTEADLIYPPPSNAFMSHRGRKRSSADDRRPPPQDFQPLDSPILRVLGGYSPF